MTDHNETPLRWFLRIVGTASLLALPCALMPLPWMDTIHQRLGLGPLPSEPVVAYLARSTSLFYALLGGLLWLVSFNLPRHRWVIDYLGAAMVVLGGCLLWVDISAGLPRWWAWYEGPWDALLGGIILWLNRRTGR